MIIFPVGQSLTGFFYIQKGEMMNKGREIYKTKKARQARKRQEVKPDQKNVCRFIDFQYNRYQKINGKNRFAGIATAEGLQVENKVFLNDGTFKYLNSKGVKITKIHDDIPRSADIRLIEKYKMLSE